ncbi:hypothetical protein HPB47_020837, partial [Ixodes persulcatus]
TELARCEAFAQAQYRQQLHRSGVTSWTPMESVTYCGWTWPTEVSWDEERGECVSATPGRRLYYLLVTVTLFFLPVAIMLTAYSLIVWKLWISQMPGERSAANINAQCRAKKKVITMVCTVLVAFVICWMPLQVIVLYSQFGDSKQRDKEMPDWFTEASSVATYVAYSNSLLNPIIYGGFNNNFRQGLCTVLHCYLRKKPRNCRMPDWFTEASSVATYVAYSNSLLNPIIYGGFNNNFRQGLCTVLHCYLRKKPSQLPLFR